MIKLKSALYAGGSTAKFIRMATEAYQAEMPEEVERFGKVGKLQYDDHELTFDVHGMEHTIVVTSVPEYALDDGEVLVDGTLMAAIEEELGHEVEECLKKNIPLIAVVDFETLLGVSHKEAASVK